MRRLKTDFQGKRRQRLTDNTRTPATSFIWTEDSSATSLLCSTCGDRLSNEAIKPPELLWHSGTKHSALLMLCCRHVKRTLLVKFQTCTQSIQWIRKKLQFSCLSLKILTHIKPGMVQKRVGSTALDS